MPGADPLDPLQYGRILPRCLPQIGPMPPLPARDDVVDGGKGESAVIQVAMTHGFRLGPGRQGSGSAMAPEGPGRFERTRPLERAQP